MFVWGFLECFVFCFFCFFWGDVVFCTVFFLFFCLLLFCLFFSDKLSTVFKITVILCLFVVFGLFACCCCFCMGFFFFFCLLLLFCMVFNDKLSTVFKITVILCLFVC